MAKVKKVSDSYTAYAKGGAKLKKGANGLMSTTTPAMRQSRTRVAAERAGAPMRRRARAAAAMASAPMMKKGGSFPDLNKDGKVTQKDILIGKGVLPKTAKKGTALKKQAATAIAMKKAGKAPKKKMMGGGMAKPIMKTGGKAKKMMGGGKCKYGC
jgi:hypothetical protein